jgi:GT2 family glycosyltransferase
MPESQSQNSEPQPEISVIVPCYNSKRTIRACLTAIGKQRTSSRFEVIVVDSSTDDTSEIVKREFPSVRLFHLSQRHFAGAARNIGAAKARAPLLLMIDSDCVAEPDLIDKMIEQHGHAEYAAVGGSMANGTPGILSGWIGYLLEFKEFTPATPKRLEKSVPTANVTYRREVFERFGGFDNDMWLAEDILFNWKLQQAGERILFDPSIRVTHLNRTGWVEVLSYQISLGRLSAIARRRGGLPGAFLLHYPILIGLMPLVRTVNAFRWFFTNDRGALLKFIFAWPFYLVSAAFWSFGFLQGVRGGAGMEGTILVKNR